MRPSIWKTRLGCVGALLGGAAAVANSDRTLRSDWLGDSADIALGGAIVGAAGLLIGAGIDAAVAGRERRRGREAEDVRLDKRSMASAPEDLVKLGSLYERGLLTEPEFSAMKQEIIGGARQMIGQTAPADSGAYEQSQRRWPRRAALVAGALAAFAALMVAAGLYRAGKEGESASVESGAGPMLNQGALPAYTELATSGFSVVVNSCDSSGAAGTVTNRGSNRAAVTVAARFYDQAGVRLGGWNDKVDGVDPATTADWYVAGGYVGVDRCEALVTSAFVTP